MKRLFLFCRLLNKLSPPEFRLILIFSGVAMLSPAFAQDFTGTYDSIPVSKPKAKKMIYQFQDPVLKEINLEANYPDNRPQSVKLARKDHLMGAAALFLPGAFTFESEMDVIWELSADLVCNPEYMNWTVTLFCLGKMETIREKASYEDGGLLPQTTRTANCEWENGAMGIILENSDTIGLFSIIMDPKESPVLKPWSDEIYRQLAYPVHTDSKNKWYCHMLNLYDINYAIIGRFRDKNIMLITNGKVKKSWFYIEENLACIYRPDIDFDKIKEPDRLPSYLLLDSAVKTSGYPDWYRLAILSRFLNSRLGQEKFSY